MACHIALLLLICVPGRLAIHCYYLPVMSWRVSFLISFFSSIFRYFVLFLGLAMTKNQITNAKCQLQFFLTFQLKKQARLSSSLFELKRRQKNLADIWFLAFDFYSLNPMKRTFLQIKTYHSQDLHYICNRVPLCPELLLPCTTYQSVPSAINLRHAFDISKRMSCLLH